MAVAAPVPAELRLVARAIRLVLRTLLNESAIAVYWLSQFLLSVRAAVIEVDESEEITVAVRADDLLEGDTANPKQHPIAIALRRQDDVDDARVTKNETLVRRGKKWFRYDAPDKRLFKQLQKTLTASD